MNPNPIQAKSTDRCTIILTPRDLFSVTEECLTHLFNGTPEPFELIVVMGGAPDEIRKKLESKFSGKARFIFKPQFLNTAELRNVGLRETKTRLAVCIDTNVLVRPNWLTPLIQCQQETGASMVVPLVLERDDTIHTAGNDLFITHKKGQAFGSMELRFHGQKVCETTNLMRRDVDFGEVHCQLFVVDTALRLGVYDEHLREGSDIDSGLTLTKAGCKMMFEPKSVVYLYYPYLIKNVIDVGLYMWKWDIPGVMASYRHIREKWNVDVGGPEGHFRHYLVVVNSRVGPLTQIYPAAMTIVLDRLFKYLLAKIRRFFSLPWQLGAWRVGYYKN
jgi:glycosyltransferase involved in cell wall biosynthesis